MPNKLKDCVSKEIDIINYQYALNKQYNELHKYGLRMDDEDYPKILLAKIQAVEMYEWLNNNNCCSPFIQCNYNYIQETLHFLKTLRLNINTTTCC